MPEFHPVQHPIRTASDSRRMALGPKWIGAVLALVMVAGCRSDGGTQVEFLGPSEWFASLGGSDEHAEPEHNVSGKTRGDISVPPMPPPIESAAPAPAPTASGESYYGVRRTGSRNELGGWSIGGDGQEPRLRPVPGSYGT